MRDTVDGYGLAVEVTTCTYGAGFWVVVKIMSVRGMVGLEALGSQQFYFLFDEVFARATEGDFRLSIDKDDCPLLVNQRNGVGGSF